jgi:hypothetical protein
LGGRKRRRRAGFCTSRLKVTLQLPVLAVTCTPSAAVCPARTWASAMPSVPEVALSVTSSKSEGAVAPSWKPTCLPATYSPATCPSPRLVRTTLSLVSCPTASDWRAFP